jgi:uncharacterized protein
MDDVLLKPCTAFDGARRISSGPLIEVALAVKNATDGGAAGPVLSFDDATGRVIDFDIRGTKEEIIARLLRSTGSAAAPHAHSVSASSLTVVSDQASSQARAPGRPKLGVVAREVTLLPRHWEWLGAQSGGASVTLRKLVDEARRASGTTTRARAAQEAAYHFMVAMAGDRPGFEEATRALFADDRALFATLIANWPEDVRDHAVKLAFGDRGAKGAGKK